MRHAPLLAPPLDVVELLAEGLPLGAVVQAGEDGVLLLEGAVHGGFRLGGFLEALGGFARVPAVVLLERLDLLVGHPLLVDEPFQRVAAPAVHRVDLAAQRARENLEHVHVAGGNHFLPLATLALAVADARHPVARPHDVHALERRNDVPLDVELVRSHEKVV